jgi:hypothetical protein
MDAQNYGGNTVDIYDDVCSGLLYVKFNMIGWLWSRVHIISGHV